MDPDLAFGAVCVLVIFLPGVVASLGLLIHFQNLFPETALSITDRFICWLIVIGWLSLLIWVLKHYTRI